MIKRARGSRDRMVSIASIAASFPSARSSGRLLSAAISRFGSLPVGIDQIVTCLHQFLAFGVGELVHYWAMLFYDHRAFALLLAAQFAAFHKPRMRRIGWHVKVR